MEIKRAIGVSPGIAFGEAFVLDSEDYPIPKRSIRPDETDHELARFRDALQRSLRELEELKRNVPHHLATEIGPIVESSIKMLDDKYTHRRIEEKIVKGRNNAEYAVSSVYRVYVKQFSEAAAGDGIFQSRIPELQDLERRLIRNLLQEKKVGISQLDRHVVVVAHDLTQAQVIAFDRHKVVGFVTDAGGRTSHTAIVARTMQIPAVVGLESISTDVSAGDTLILDGASGTVIINPDEDTLKKYRALQRNLLRERHALREVIDLAAETRDGHAVKILANIEFPEEVKTATEFGACGIGLYRTEFLYLTPGKVPSEADHFEAYRRTLSLLGDRELTIRTLDLGADKMGVEGSVKEANPFLGCRGIRLCFERMDLFRPQLRAILRVAALGNVKVMFPMITSLEELQRAKAILHQVHLELEREGVPHEPRLRVGIMVEVPAAAMMADVLAREADFFSIGTNDLIQYVMAVDRVNERIAPLFQPTHPAVLRLLRKVLEEGERHGRPVCLCGEMAGDPIFTILLLGLGLREFSMIPTLIPQVKKVMRSVTLKEAREVAHKVFSFGDSARIADFLTERTRKIFPEAR